MRVCLRLLVLLEPFSCRINHTRGPAVGWKLYTYMFLQGLKFWRAVAEDLRIRQRRCWIFEVLTVLLLKIWGFDSAVAEDLRFWQHRCWRFEVLTAPLLKIWGSDIGVARLPSHKELCPWPSRSQFCLALGFFYERRHRKFFTQPVKLLIYIREMSSSTICRDIGRLHWGFRCFSQP